MEGTVPPGAGEGRPHSVLLKIDRTMLSLGYAKPLPLLTHHIAKCTPIVFLRFLLKQCRICGYHGGICVHKASRMV